MSKAGLEEGRCRVGARYGGGYVIERLFARGGMAELYVANHEITRRQVAFKVLNRRYAQEPNIVRRAEQEARALAEIDHPNVVKILDAGTDPEVGLFIAMELLDGKSVREVLARVERLPLPQALTIAIEIAEATHGLHQLGIFHRDIKPDNVFVCRPADGRFCLKLLDLGAAKVPKYGLPTTTVGQTIGTARYMSPEHIQRGEITAASDQYALAHMLYEMLTGWHPFSSDIAQPSYVEL
ncbi:MAG: serine/threonine protein kinase, partial [Deltaproteobacteria bacterium]|nr:serine/threonine protein kinase [Deltaproteobacteria bacterium]